MNKNLKRTIIILSIIFLVFISTSSMISANDLNSTDSNITSENSHLKEINIENEILTSDNDSLEKINTIDEVENVEITDIYVNDGENTNGNENVTFKTIKEAIDYGNSKSNLVIINIYPGTYNETNMTITNTMIIKALNGSVTLDGHNQGWFFYSNSSNNNLSLIGLTFKNGVRYNYYDATVGGVVRTEGHIDVVNCTFESNFGGAGGAIHSENGANLINSTFKNNKAEYTGAGIYNIYGQTNIINCTFHKNTAKRQGGAIRIQGDTYIENSTFTDNYAGTGNFAGNGGAVRVTEGDLNIESSVFRNNSAKFEGGAISAGDESQYSNDHYQLNINNSTIVGNRARTGAGIIANDGINLTNSVLSNNSIPYSDSAKYSLGTAIYILNGDTNLIGNTIQNNTNPYGIWGKEPIYSYQGTVAQKDNDWGSNTTSCIKNNSGKTTSEVKAQPTINKPQITIQTGKLKKEDKTDEPNTPNENNSDDKNNHGTTTNNQDNQGTGQTNTQNSGNNANPIKTDNNNPYATNNQNNGNKGNPIRTGAKPFPGNTQNNPNPTNNKNNGNRPAFKTSNTKNTATSNENATQSNQDGNQQTGYSENMIETNTTNFNSNADLGENSDPISNNGRQGQESQAVHELSAKKSTIEQNSIIPQIILIAIVLITFLIGYRYNKKDE